MRSCDALYVERKMNEFSDHAFKLSNTTTINKMCAIEGYGGRFASLYPIVLSMWCPAVPSGAPTPFTFSSPHEISDRDSCCRGALGLSDYV